MELIESVSCTAGTSTDTRLCEQRFLMSTYTILFMLQNAFGGQNEQSPDIAR